MRVAIDYTPALKQIGGVGRYTRSLVEALIEQPPNSTEFLLWAAADAPGEPRFFPANSASAQAQLRRLPLPERWLTIGWQRLRVPLAIERAIGDVDLIHATDFVGPPSRAPQVVTVHDLSYLITPQYAHPKLRRYLSAAVPRSLRRASRVVAVSETTANDLTERYGVPRQRITVIRHGVDPMFRPPEREAVEDALTRYGIRRPYFIIVGTIEPRKNHLGLLQAFESLCQTQSEASLVIVGRPGWLSDPIMAAIQDAEQRHHVRHLSDVGDRDLPALYAGSVALAYPSWYEGFGLPVVEAMASGTVAITSDLGSLKEIGASAAMLVPPGDSDALADAMERVLDSTALRAELVAKGAAHAATMTWQAAASAHLRLYSEVVKSR